VAEKSVTTQPVISPHQKCSSHVKDEMNAKIVELIRKSCANCEQRGIAIVCGGPWMEWKGTDLLSVDPIAAVIVDQGRLPEGHDPTKPETLVNPGLIRVACELLDVDHAWLYRFWMGYDRNYQILFYSDEERKNATKDDVSAFGIAMRKELFKE
jgi:hypothetical protein